MIQPKSAPLWHGPVHTESWLLRLALLGTLVAQAVYKHNQSGAVVAAEGLFVSLFPLLVQKLSKVHVPRPMEFVFVFEMAMQFISESTKLFEHLTYWDKAVHPTLIALTSMLVAWMLLGYRQAEGRRLPTQLIAAIAMLFGSALGAFWEFVEFTSDWFLNSGLQKSNADTTTDMFSNDIGALVMTLVGLWVYQHWISRNQGMEMGEVGKWLVSGPAKLLTFHGRAVGVVAAVLFVSVAGGALWIDRGTPALAADIVPGPTQQLALANGNLPTTATLLGFWKPDPRGVCRVNEAQPEPGAEKEGLLEFAPGTSYGTNGTSFTLAGRYIEERPPISNGTQMDAGIAFGIRDAQNYYVLEESALHDILRLSQYVHGRRRDVREKLLRTRGNEWHTLSAAVNGSSVTAGIDGSMVYQVSGVQSTSGGIGVWGMTAAASCFSDVSVEVGIGH